MSRIYDDNGDNTLDVDEFCSAIMTMGWSASQAMQVFGEIDKDGSGVISLDEFIQWFAENGRDGWSHMGNISETDTPSNYSE